MVNIKKIALTCILILGLFLVGCGESENILTNSSIDVNNIKEITVINDSTGKTSEIKDSEKIGDVISALEGIEVQKEDTEKKNVHSCNTPNTEKYYLELKGDNGYTLASVQVSKEDSLIFTSFNGDYIKEVSKNESIEELNDLILN